MPTIVPIYEWNRCSESAVWESWSWGIGTGASNAFYPVLRESDGAFTMLGRPVLFTEKCPALGTAGDVIFVDLSQYVIGLRKEVMLDRSQHVKFRSDQTMLRALVRLNGQPVWDKVVTPKKAQP